VICSLASFVHIIRVWSHPEKKKKKEKKRERRKKKRRRRRKEGWSRLLSLSSVGAFVFHLCLGSRL
jgi:predicted dienelactone hydrolase